MKIDSSYYLIHTFKESNSCLNTFIDNFKIWKTDWSINEYSVHEFGKDSGLISPKVDGKSYQLRHVHLIPTEKKSLNEWNINYKKEKRRTSDKMLIYVEDNQNFLLIAILPENLSHKIIAMKEPKDQQLMENFAEAASEYVNYKKIII